MSKLARPTGRSPKEVMSDCAKRVPKARDTYVSLHGLGVKRFVAMPVRGALGHKIDLRQGFQRCEIKLFRFISSIVKSGEIGFHPEIK